MTQSVETDETAGERWPADQERWDGTTVSYRPRTDWRDRVDPGLEFYEDAEDDIDPVTFEVIRNRLWTTNLAHGEQVTRVSGSPVFTALDFNMSILTEDGEIVESAPFIQFLNAGAPFGVRYLLEHLSSEPRIEDGDVFLLNDPWIAAVHEMDVLFLRPVFVEGRLFGWVSNAGHQYDLGGVVPGGWPQNAVDVFHDPTVFTPLKIMSRNRMRGDLERMYLRNSRVPDVVALDLRAQLSGCLLAGDRVLELCEQFGPATVKGAMRRIIDNAQAAFSRKLQRIPDGTWTEVKFLDQKLPGDRGTYRMQVNVTKTGDRLRVDNRGTAEQPDEGPIGFPFAAAVGSVVGVMSVSMVFEQLFSLGGASRQIDYDFEPGRISCANHPAAVSAGIMSSIAHLNAMQQCVSRMLACDPELKRDAVVATPDFGVAVVAGRTAGGEPYGQAMLDIYGVGSGARADGDGVDTSGPSWSPLTALLSVESVEQWFPLLYLYRHEVTDSAGAGRWRGGLGFCFAWIPFNAGNMDVVQFSGAMANSAYSGPGLFGGYPSPASRLAIARDSDVLEQFAAQRVPATFDDVVPGELVLLPGKANAVALGPADVCECRICGGGGYGDPLDREPARVAADVAAGAVSADAAASAYGVVLTGDGSVDDRATEAHRHELLAERSSWAPAGGGGDAVPSPAAGEPPRAAHEYLTLRDDGERRVLACTACDHVVCGAGDNYREHLLMHESDVGAIPGGPGAPPSDFIDAEVVFRRFCCPGCRKLLSTDVVVAGEPVGPEMRFATGDVA